MLAGYALPAAQKEIADACGENRSVFVYDIAARDIERALRILPEGNRTPFMLRLGPGKAELSSDITISGRDVVLAGAPMQIRVVSTSAASKSSTWHTKLDLKKHKIDLSSNAQLCLQVYIGMHCYC